MLEFLGLWFADWKARMSNGAAIILTLLGFVTEPTAVKGSFFAAAILVFIYGSYHIWKKERNAVEKKQAELDEEKAKYTKPKIKVEILEVYPEFTINTAGKHPHFIDYYFTIKAHLYNKNRPIAIRRFELHVNFDRGVKLTNTTPFEHLELKREQRLTPKYGMCSSTVESVQEPLSGLSKTLIAHGDNREGWLRFVLPEVSNEELDEIKGITLCVVDAESNLHKAKADKIQWRQSGELINKHIQAQLRYIEREKRERIEGQRRHYHDELRLLTKDFRILDRSNIEEVYLTELKNELNRKAEKLLADMESDLSEPFVAKFKEKGIDGLQEILNNLFAN